MTPRPILLNPTEARMACLAGAERMIRALRNGSRTEVRTEVLWGQHIEGAGAELAFAKAVGWFWDDTGDSPGHHPDVRHVHVRQTSRATGNLLIRPSADAHGVYALVTGNLPRYVVRGWVRWPGCPGTERRPDPDRPPVLMVAQADLQDLGELDGQAAAAYGGP